MRRRDFFKCVTATAVAWPLSARAADPGKTFQVAIFAGGDSIADLSETTGHRHWQTWHREMRQLGYSEGRNLIIHRRSTEGDRRRVPDLVREITDLKPDVIIVPPPDLVDALRRATTTIPIIAFSADPVRYGFAASLAQPGGNITGFTIDAGPEIIGKRMALLKEAVPTSTHMGVLMLREYWEGWIGDVYREAAQRVGFRMFEAPLRSPVSEDEYRRAFAAMVHERVDAVLVSPQSEHVVHRRLVAALTTESRLPTMHSWREPMEAGGLMAFAIDLVDVARRTAAYTDRILRGAKPAEMPFQQPTKFELVVNLRTAKAIGITITPTILQRADEVIE